MIRFFAVALSFGALACARREGTPVALLPPPPAQASVFITSDLRGYLGPCGCSENMRGGIERTAGLLESARAGGRQVFYFEGGDTFFGQLNVPESAVPQAERKARALGQALRAMGVVATARGALDESRGASFLDSLGLPALSEGSATWLDVGGRRVAVVYGQEPAALADAVAHARAKEATLVVVIAALTFPQVLPLDLTGADVVVAARTPDDLGGEENRLKAGVPTYVQAQSKGRSVVRIDVHFEGEGRAAPVASEATLQAELAGLDARIELLRAQVNEPGLEEATLALKKSKLDDMLEKRARRAGAPPTAPKGSNVFSVQTVPIESTLPPSKTVAQVVADYDRDVGLLNVAWARKFGTDCPAPGKNEAGFVGSASCTGCHAKAAAFYATTKHARAFEALKVAGKQFHLDCIGCHVTGWQRPAGVCRIDKTEGREDVGCESCHGPGAKHVAAPTKARLAREVTRATCTRCHDRENSPHFVFETYRATIVGSGHGAP